MSEMIIKIVARHHTPPTEEESDLLLKRIGGAIGYNKAKCTLTFRFHRSGHVYTALPQVIEHVVSAYHEAFGDDPFDFVSFIAVPKEEE